jgi:DNA-binding NarL/FixJ family response regulator
MAKNLGELTQRQRQILLLLRLGKTNDEIANELEISVNTVKTHLKSLYTKLEVSNRTQATFIGNSML